MAAEYKRIYDLPRVRPRADDHQSRKKLETYNLQRARTRFFVRFHRLILEPPLFSRINRNRNVIWTDTKGT